MDGAVFFGTGTVRTNNNKEVTMNSHRKMTKKTFKTLLKGDSLDKIRDEERKKALHFINDEVGEENFVTITECRSPTYWECVVWYWTETPQ